MALFLFCFSSESKRVNSICHDAYSGPAPYSEVETQNIRDFLEKISPTPILTLALHSYGQVLIYPYVNDKNNHPPNVFEIVSEF